MKYLKTYEKLKRDPKIGDYVICYEQFSEPEVNEFYENNIGQIVDITKVDNSDSITTKFDQEEGWDYWVKFDHIPPEIFGDVNHNKVNDYENFFVYNIRPFRKKEIVRYSTKKSELELEIDANKYNL